MKKLLIALAICTLTFVPHIALAETNRAQTEEIVREYLLENPEILLEMQEVLAEREAEAEKLARANVFSTQGNSIYNNGGDPVIGNPDGDVTIVEFFDYNCSYCRRAHSDVLELIENDNNVRIVMKEFPILGPNSQAAHTVSLAFNSLKPEDYAEFLDKLITSPGQANEASAMALASTFGVEESALRAEMAKATVILQVQETYQLAQMLGISGTPTYVIGDEVLPGAVGSDELAKRIQKMRECDKTSC
ncbi:MAG: DsbA family protein [Pseudomonadota bacterium]